MLPPLDSVGAIGTRPLEGAISPAAPSVGGGFAEVLGSAITGAGKTEAAAEDAAKRFAAGDPGMGIHEVVIASEKANIAVRYAVTLKNRVIEAYRELMNTPL